MKRILIADSSKASLVITSEVFKDHFPGVQVVVARTSADALELAKNDVNLDAIVVDFDLPDRDGAETAARLKKSSNTPILITGFERPGVAETIERECAGYDDCLNWLRKPVKPELVVAVAQRYCEGKFRTQRRLVCEIPALFELAVTVQTTLPAPLTKAQPAAKTKAGSAKGSAKAVVAAKPKGKIQTVVKKTWVPAYVEDCSLGGLKLRIPREKVNSLSLAAPAVEAVNSLRLGEVLCIQLPNWQTLLSQTELTHGTLTRESTLRKQTISKKTSEAKPVAEIKMAKKGTAEAGPTVALPSLKGKVAWTTSASTAEEWVIGIQSENATILKKLFDSILESNRVL